MKNLLKQKCISRTKNKFLNTALHSLLNFSVASFGSLGLSTVANAAPVCGTFENPICANANITRGLGNAVVIGAGLRSVYESNKRNIPQRLHAQFKQDLSRLNWDYGIQSIQGDINNIISRLSGVTAVQHYNGGFQQANPSNPQYNGSQAPQPNDWAQPGRNIVRYKPKSYENPAIKNQKGWKTISPKQINGPPIYDRNLEEIKAAADNYEATFTNSGYDLFDQDGNTAASIRLKGPLVDNIWAQQKGAAAILLYHLKYYEEQRVVVKRSKILDEALPFWEKNEERKLVIIIEN